MTHTPDVISLAQAIAAQHDGKMMLPVRAGLAVMGQSGGAHAAHRRLDRGTLPFPTVRVGSGRQHYVSAVTLARIILGEPAEQSPAAEPQRRRRGPGRPRKTIQQVQGVRHAG